jgi:hypothetical protein
MGNSGELWIDSLKDFQLLNGIANPRTVVDGSTQNFLCRLPNESLRLTLSEKINHRKLSFRETKSKLSEQ